MKAVMIFKDTGAVRIFQSVNLCEEWYGPNTPNRYLSERDLAQKIPVHHLLQTYANIYWRHKEKADKLGIWLHPPEVGMDYKDVWALANLVGDQVNRPPRADTKPGYMINLTECKAAYARWESGQLKLPKQVGAILDWLISESYDFYTKEEIQEAANRVEFLRRVRTRQDGWRIWRYYSPKLIELECIRKTEAEG